MSCTVDSTSGNVGELTDRTSETVADALHLQNSVIGDKKIAPAPPEIVAQIIAETLTPTPITEQAETSQIQNLILSNARLKKNQNQIFKQIEIMKKLTLFQERDNIVEESQQTLIEVEAQLSSFQKSLGVKDSEILQLKEEKAATEIALKAVVEEKSSVDKGLENLRGDVGKVEKSFRSMKQDLKNKSAELDKIQMEKNSLLVQVEEFSKCVKMEKQKAKVTMTENKSKLMDELQSQKVQYEDENVKEKDSLKNELCQSREKLSQTESELKKLHQEIETLKGSGDGVASQEMMNENKVLKDSLENIEKQHNKELSWQKQKYEKLETNLSTLLSELTDRPAVFDTNVELLSSKLREITGVKDQLETELDMAKKKYEITMLEQQNQVTSELQKLARELETVKIEKQRLENQLFEIQRIKSQEIEEYQSQLSALDEQLQLERQQHEESIPSQETNQKLEQELEKEKGRVAGLMQTNSSLKQYVSQLKEVLARRESSLVDVQRHMEGLVRKWQEGEEDYNKSMHNLEEVLQQEKDGQRELKIQDENSCKHVNSILRQTSEEVKHDTHDVKPRTPIRNKARTYEDGNPFSIQTQENPDPQSLETMIPIKNEHERTLCSPSGENEAMEQESFKLSAKVSEINEDLPEENVFKEEKSKILEQGCEEDCNPSSIQTQENPDLQSLENMSEEKQLLTDTDKMIPVKNEHERTLCSPSGDNEAMEQESFKLSAKVSEINEDSPEENVFKEEKSKILEQDYEEDCNPSSIQTQENPDPQSLENMSEEKQLLTDTDKMIPMKSEHERTLCSPSDDNEATRLRRLKLSAKDKDEEPPLGDMLVEDLRFEERSKISKSRKQNIEEEPPVVDILEKKLKLKKQRCQECEELRKKVRELEREKERSEEDYGDVYEAGRLAIISEMEENKKQKDKNAKLEKDVKKTEDENVRLEDEKARLADEKARLADEKARLADEKARLEKECEELKTCKICLDGEKKIILIPCGHFGLCQNCYSNNNSLRNCPYCKKEITDHVKVFHP